eukprot:gnl/TRDRNA2_/TRDRNA2_189457_c0_seq1.p1 gnl/TRDRNA2_/TRDRNA2_189457_c0~~gnl/TRDRNA2_/TRDRNA2_189457_c0_seq1.p1  ORF type:complete len:520 (+),score=126.36 gnl/TRDRNA2_/TRDRNA2_189457_c0_seq1:199-1758(+)
MGCSKSKQIAPEESSKAGATEEAPKVVEKEKAADAPASPPKPGCGATEDIRDKYEIGNMLGSGSFGQVREARLKEGNSTEVRAVKMIERDQEDGEWSNQAIFVREVALLQQIKHDNIIRYYDFYEDPHFLYVVMELCRGGEVFAKIVELKRFSERDAAILGQQMLRSIEYIHNLKIAHRDIKAENFMLSEPTLSSAVKMIDFGMATKFEDGQVLSELCGSPHYLAPELIGQKYNHLADIWAFGVLLYLIMYGHYPYDAKHPRDIMVKILTEPINWKSSKAKLSGDAIAFMKQLLEHNPKKRMTAIDALKHPWVSHPQATADTEISQDTLRSAHKKVTSTRKAVDQKIDQLRNQKLQKIDEDFKQGVRHGGRVGPTPTEEFMAKPEFLRRENKLTTAPSSMDKVAKGAALGAAAEKKDGPLANMMKITEGDDDEKKGDAASPGTEDAVSPLPKPKPRARAASVTPRRLSYIGTLSPQEETNLAKLFEEKRAAALPGGNHAANAANPFAVLPEPASQTEPA